VCGTQSPRTGRCGDRRAQGDRILRENSCGQYGVGGVRIAQIRDVPKLSSYTASSSLLFLGGTDGIISYIGTRSDVGSGFTTWLLMPVCLLWRVAGWPDMEKFPLRLKDDALLVTDFFADPNGAAITAMSVFMPSSTHGTAEHLRKVQVALRFLIVPPPCCQCFSCSGRHGALCGARVRDGHGPDPASHPASAVDGAHAGPFPDSLGAHRARLFRDALREALDFRLIAIRRGIEVSSVRC